MKERYVHRLRKDMPRGFISNDIIPEYLVMHEYLRQFEGRTFFTKGEFKAILGGFHAYLKEKKVASGPDHEIRQGLFLLDDLSVVAYNDNFSERCFWGRLEEIIQPQE